MGSEGERDVDAISGSCWAGNGYSDRVSTVSPLLSIMGLPVVTITSRPDEEPATGAISTSGRATSGSGLGAPPGISGWISAHVVTSERPVRECDLNTMPEGLDSKTASGRSSSGSGRSRTGPEPDIEVGQLNWSRLETPRIHTRSAVLTEILPNCWNGLFYGTHFYVCFLSFLCLMDLR